MNRPPARTVPQAIMNATPPLRVLIVDDSPIAARC